MSSIKQLLERMPYLLRSKDLIDLGLFPNKQSIYRARKRGNAPPVFTGIPGKFLYPKDKLLEWIENNTSQW